MDIEFTYDRQHFRATTDDPEIFVEGLGWNRDRSRDLCLHWHGRKIVFRVTLEEKQEEDGGISCKWLIQKLPAVHLEVKSHNFSTIDEHRDAIRLAVLAMNTFAPPGWEGGDRKLKITTELSELMKGVWATGRYF